MIMGYLGLLLFLIITEQVTRYPALPYKPGHILSSLAQHLLTEDRVVTDMLQSPQVPQTIRYLLPTLSPYTMPRCEVGARRYEVTCASSLLGGGALSSLLASFQVP